jgi:hypothetical protein
MHPALTCRSCTQAKSKEKHGIRDPMPELTITSPACPLQSRLQHIYHGQPYASVDFIPQSRTFDLAFVCCYLLWPDHALSTSDLPENVSYIDF